MTSDTRTCPRCAHRLHAPHGCEARYHVTFEAGEPGDPCLCPEAALPALPANENVEQRVQRLDRGPVPPSIAPPADGVPRTAAGRALLYAIDAVGNFDLTIAANSILAIEAEAAQPAPGLDVGLLISATHEALCDVSHHDAHTVCKNERKYEMVADYILAAYQRGPRELEQTSHGRANYYECNVPGCTRDGHKHLRGDADIEEKA